MLITENTIYEIKFITKEEAKAESMKFLNNDAKFNYLVKRVMSAIKSNASDGYFNIIIELDKDEKRYINKLVSIITSLGYQTIYSDSADDNDKNSLCVKGFLRIEWMI